MYAMMCTRLGLDLPLSVLSRFVGLGHHTDVQWAAAKRVLHYLRATSDLALILGGSSLPVLFGYSDSSYADSRPDRHSSQGYGFTLGSGLISWRSARPSFDCLSTCKAELYAGTLAAKEARWLSFLLAELGHSQPSVTLSCDSASMIHLTENPVYHARSKHIEVRYFVRELMQSGFLCLRKVAAIANLVDIFPKALFRAPHRFYVRALGLGVLRFARCFGRALEFPNWLLRTKLYLQSQHWDGDTLWAHICGNLRSPPHTHDLPEEPTDIEQERFDKACTTLSVLQSRDAAACIGLASLLPESEEAHFSQVPSSQACFAAIETHYSTPSSASLGRLFMSFMFPDLGASSWYAAAAAQQ
ncbi:unnamed protein product [Closterium sp. NIES-54]